MEKYAVVTTLRFLYPAKDRISFIEFDWMTNNMYVSTICGELNLCNTDSLKCVKLRDLGEPGIVAAKILPQRGYAITFYASFVILRRKHASFSHYFVCSLLFWCETKLTGNLKSRRVTATAASSLFQANMDGTSSEVVVNGIEVFNWFHIDSETARLYWTYMSGTAIWEYDIDGRISRQFRYPSMPPAVLILFASRNLIYFTDSSEKMIYRGTADGRNFTEIYTAEDGETPSIISTLWTESKTQFFNPCQKHDCPGLCALSGPGRAS